MGDAIANEWRANTIVEEVERAHGDALHDGDLAFLRQRLDRASEMLAALDRVQLANSDEPDVTFAVTEVERTAGRRRA